VWGKRQAAMERAAQRIAPAAIPRLLTRLARLDALAKGIPNYGNPWDDLRDLALMLCRSAVPAAA
jgi:DNA polymerase III delta subunit